MPVVHRILLFCLMAGMPWQVAFAELQIGHPYFEVLKTPLLGGRLVALDVAVRRDGIVFIATSHGLATYDGERWDLISTPNNGTMESLAAADDGRVFVGMRDDFGVFELQKNQQLKYRSLRDHCVPKNFQLGTCRKVIINEGAAYIAFSKGIAVCRLNDIASSSLLYVSAPRPLQSLSLVDGRLIACCRGAMIYEFASGEFDSILNDSPNGSSRPQGSPRGSLVGCCAFDEKDLLVASHLHGLSLVRGEQFVPFETELSSRKKALRIVGINRLSSDRYLILKEDGLCLIDGGGHIVTEIHPDDGDGIGACTNRACVDHEGVLWVPMFHSGPLAKLDLSCRSRRFNVDRKLVHWVREDEDSLLVSTSDAVVKLNRKHGQEIDRPIVPLASNMERSKSAVRVGKELLIGTSRGLVVISEGDEQLIGPPEYLTTGVYLPKHNCVVFGSYGSGMILYRRDEDVWERDTKVVGLPGNILDVVVDPESDVLYFTASLGAGGRVLHRMPIGHADLKSEFSADITTHGDVSRTGIPQIVYWNGAVVFNSVHGLRRWEHTTKVFVPLVLPSLQGILPGNACATLAVDSAENLWVATIAGELMRVSPAGDVDWPRGLLPDDVVARIFAPGDSDFVWIRTLSNDVIQLPVNQSVPTAVVGTRISTIRQEGEVPIRTDAIAKGETFTARFGGPPVVLRYETNSVHQLPKNAYQYRLSGLHDEWSEWTGQSEQEYRSLPAGDYLFEVRSRGRNFKPGKADSFSFRILPPWYNTWLAWIGYGVAAIVLTGGTVRWRTREAQIEVNALEQVVSERTVDLEASIEKYRWLVEGLEENYIFFTTTQDGLITYVSPSVENVLGYKVHEMIDKDWQSFPESSENLNASLQAAPDHDAPPVMASSVLCKDGSRRWLELTQFPQKNPNHRSEPREYIAKDVTHLKQARERLTAARDELEDRVNERTAVLTRVNRQLGEEMAKHQDTAQQLVESEQRYRTIVEDQSEFVIRFDKDGRLTFANRAYRERHGLTPETVSSFNVFSVMHPENREETIQKIRSLKSGDPVHVPMIRVLDREGNADWADWHGRALFDDDGNLLGYQGAGRVITDLVEAQQKLRESELQYRSVVEDQTEMIVRFDLHSVITFANTAFLKAYNLSADEAVGAKLSSVLSSENYARHKANAGTVTAETPTRTDVYRLVGSDGETIYQEWSGRGIFDNQGQLISYQGVGRDVTQLRTAQRKLEEKEEQLAHLARVSALGEMVAGISHEINQPLATIANFAAASRRTLERDQTSADDMEKLKTWSTRTSRQTEKINAIIQRLRRFTRPGSHLERFAIGDAVAEALLVTETRTRYIVDLMEVECPESIPEVNADRIQIEQVIVNLIRNACDAMEAIPCGRRKLSVCARSNSNEVLVTIKDSGPGVSAERTSEIFQTFTTSKSEGVGIGLAISRNIIESHGGSIRAVASDSGGWFEFSLPISQHEGHE